VGTKNIDCGNKNLWLWEQIYGCGNKTNVCGNKKHMVVGTKQKYRLWEQKPMVVGTNLWLWEQNKNIGCENKNLWLWEQIYGCGNKSMVVGTKI
jgi:hypothetical protein